MATIKIGDLLDLSSPLAASTSPSGELPRLAATVHHRPPNYTPENVAKRRERKPPNPTRCRIKVEKDEEEKCPNILVRNGAICTPYRAIKRENGRIDEFAAVYQGRREAMTIENGAREEMSGERGGRSHIHAEQKQETGKNTTLHT